jgi:hypothetical protein
MQMLVERAEVESRARKTRHGRTAVAGFSQARSRAS